MYVFLNTWYLNFHSVYKGMCCVRFSMSVEIPFLYLCLSQSAYSVVSLQMLLLLPCLCEGEDLVWSLLCPLWRELQQLLCLSPIWPDPGLSYHFQVQTWVFFPSDCPEWLGKHSLEVGSEGCWHRLPVKLEAGEGKEPADKLLPVCLSPPFTP